jgi:hypothetical protein
MNGLSGWKGCCSNLSHLLHIRAGAAAASMAFILSMTVILLLKHVKA